MRGGRTVFVVVIWQRTGLFFSSSLSLASFLFISFRFCFFFSRCFFLSFLLLFHHISQFTTAIHLNQCFFNEKPPRRKGVCWCWFSCMFLFRALRLTGQREINSFDFGSSNWQYLVVVVLSIHWIMCVLGFCLWASKIATNSRLWVRLGDGESLFEMRVWCILHISLSLVEQLSDFNDVSNQRHSTEISNWFGFIMLQCIANVKLPAFGKKTPSMFSFQLKIAQVNHQLSQLIQVIVREISLSQLLRWSASTMFQYFGQMKNKYHSPHMVWNLFLRRYLKRKRKKRSENNFIRLVGFCEAMILFLGECKQSNDLSIYSDHSIFSLSLSLHRSLLHHRATVYCSRHMKPIVVTANSLWPKFLLHRKYFCANRTLFSTLTITCV